jgi:hypothetical protein
MLVIGSCIAYYNHGGLTGDPVHVIALKLGKDLPVISQGIKPDLRIGQNLFQGVVYLVVLKNLCDICSAANKGKAVNRRKTILKADEA